jgi:hypothetical protein
MKIACMVSVLSSSSSVARSTAFRENRMSESTIEATRKGLHGPVTRRELVHAALATIVSSICTSAPVSAQTRRYGFFATTAMAEAGFIYGLPIVMNYAVMYEQAVDRHSGHFKASFNQLKNEDRIFSSEDANVVLPNNDTPYSFVWMDLRADPIVLSVPAVNAKRYYSITLRDGKFYNYGYIGSRATGSQAGSYLVVGPDWSGEAPSDIKKVFRSNTQFSLALFRTQLFDPDDIENVRKVQAGYKLEPLSRYTQQASPKPAQPIDFPRIRKSLLRKNFFQHLAFALQFAPAQLIEADAVASLANLGVGPGRTFDFDRLPTKDKVEIGLGIRLGDRKIDQTVTNANVTVNGWRIAPYFGDSAFYSGNWLLRAAAAKVDFYGNDPQEAILALAEVDDDERRLDGSKHDYTLTFAQDQLPPVNAFWSVTMYDGSSRALAENPVNRYLVNSSMLSNLKTNTNGGLTIYIQHGSPGPGKRANWLPAPSGPMLLGMRLYWPKLEQPSILPIGRGTWRPPGVKRVQ